MRPLILTIVFLIATSVVGLLVFFLMASPSEALPPEPQTDPVPAPESEAKGGNSTIAVEMSDIRNSNGEIKITLFNTGDGYPEDVKSVLGYEYAEIVDGKASCTFDGLVPGTYAIIILHDEDKDGDMTSNRIGVPKEGVGVSNNAKMKFGPPKWKDSKFEVTEGTVKQNIKMTYFF